MANLSEWASFLKCIFDLPRCWKCTHISIPPSPTDTRPPPSLPPSWPLTSHAFLLSHLIQFITVSPPPRYTQLSGETKALPNMDAFLFTWICAALPWGCWTTPLTSSVGGNGIQKGWTEHSHSGGHILVRVIIECKKAGLKGKWRSKGRY